MTEEYVRQNMNSYAHQLTRTNEEIDSFASSPEGTACDSDWYADIKGIVEKVRFSKDDEEAEKYLDMLLRCIVDSGPLGKGFAPSINAAADAMQRKRKRIFRAQRIKKKEDTHAKS